MLGAMVKAKNCKALLALLLAACVFAAFFKAYAALSGYLRLSAVNAKKAEIMRFTKDYDKLSSKTSAVYFKTIDYDDAKAAERAAAVYLPLLCKEAGLSETPFATIVLFPSRNEMYAAIGYDDGNSRESSPSSSGFEPAGAYSGGVVSLYSGAISDVFLKTLIHELSHLVLDEKTNGNVAEWFSEGVALFYEEKYAGGVTKHVSEGEKASYKRLSGAFKYVDKREGLRKSLEIIRFIDKHGSLTDIYEAAANGASVDSALKKSLGNKYGRLDDL